MALDLSDLQSASSPSVSPVAAPADRYGSLAQIPVIQSVLKGEVAAIYAPPTVLGDGHADEIPKLTQAVQNLKLGFAQAPNTGAVVVFNPQLVTPEEIAQADATGTLDQIAANVAGNAAPPAPQAVPQAAAQLPDGTTTPSALNTARLANVTPQPPTRQALPSQGNIVNGLLKRAI